MATQLDNQFILSLDRDNHTCKITSFKSKDDSSIFDLTIPSKIEQDGEEYTVTSIGYGAFSECPRLTSITIPDSVTEIGDEAFAACKNLTSVFIPDSITKIGEGTFRGCRNLNIGLLLYDKGRKCYGWVGNKKVCKGAIIPDGVTSINNYAFARCTKLTNITIPDGVTYIGDKAFCECSSLTSIIIPDNVTSIGEEAFYRCSRLTNITIPDGVTYIGDKAFCECSSLTSIIIPDNVTSIGKEAFYRCSSLTSITIPDGVTSIGSYAFHYCEKLTSINIPDSVTEIGVGAFDGCEKLTSINIPDSVTEIGVGAFDGCEKLTSINIPNGVTDIKNWVFNGCSSLTNISTTKHNVELKESIFNGCTALSEDVKDKFIRDCDARIGKEICNQLRKIRVEIAKRNGIDFSPAECDHKEDCMGTCPMCEQEIEFLEKKIKEKRKNGTLNKSLDEKNIIPVEKIEISDSEKEEIKELIKENIRQNTKDPSEEKAQMQLVESIKILKKSLAKDWANVKIEPFSNRRNFGGVAYVTTGLTAPKDIKEFEERRKKEAIDQYVQNEEAKIGTILSYFSKTEEIEKRFAELNRIGKDYGGVDDDLTYLIDKDVVLDRIETISHNIEKIKQYLPNIPDVDDLIRGFTTMGYETDVPKTIAEIKERIEAKKRDVIYKLNKHISEFADRWEIQKQELNEINDRLNDISEREKDELSEKPLPYYTLTAPIFGIRRHCLASDGKGVTTLVTFKGCPLKCKYCLNGQNLLSSTPVKYMSVDELIETLKVDDLYFRSTGGGVTFGGGEPLLHTVFIREFISKMPSHWKVTVETSLNVPQHKVMFENGVDLYIVDCKDMNNDIYHKYTGKDNDLVIKNLKELHDTYLTMRENYEMGLISDSETPKYDIKVRVPLIKGINTPEDQKESIRILNEIGITNIEEFEYIVPD